MHSYGIELRPTLGNRNSLAGFNQSAKHIVPSGRELFTVLAELAVYAYSEGDTKWSPWAIWKVHWKVSKALRCNKEEWSVFIKKTIKLKIEFSAYFLDKRENASRIGSWCPLSQYLFNGHVSMKKKLAKSEMGLFHILSLHKLKWVLKINLDEKTVI